MNRAQWLAKLTPPRPGGVNLLKPANSSGIGSSSSRAVATALTAAPLPSTAGAVPSSDEDWEELFIEHTPTIPTLKNEGGNCAQNFRTGFSPAYFHRRNPPPPPPPSRMGCSKRTTHFSRFSDSVGVHQTYAALHETCLWTPAVGVLEMRDAFLGAWGVYFSLRTKHAPCSTKSATRNVFDYPGFGPFFLQTVQTNAGYRIVHCSPPC